jgi:hypothetical protein
MTGRSQHLLKEQNARLESILVQLREAQDFRPLFKRARLDVYRHQTVPVIRRSSTTGSCQEFTIRQPRYRPRPLSSPPQRYNGGLS